ncbi:MAG: hypothetical protein ABI199_02660 [Bacteroidia bacterium]
MKKLFFGFALLAIIGFSSCGNSNTVDKKPISDSIVKPVAKSVTDSLLNLANQTVKSDSLSTKNASADSLKAKKTK